MWFGKKKKGYVYVAESTRRDGTRKIYTGKTTRSPYIRMGEHINSVKSPNKSSWVSKGERIRLIGAVRSSNPTKAEKTIKRMSPSQKKAIGRYGASKYSKRSSWD